jgi:hypothetical protein
MIRLNAADFQRKDVLEDYAKVSGMTIDEFRAHFEYVTAHESGD